MTADETLSSDRYHYRAVAFAWFALGALAGVGLCVVIHP